METLTHTEEVQRLFVRHLGRIRGFIIGLVADLSLADDVLQEVFLVLTRKADDFALGTNFMAWVHAIARRKVLELVRQQGRLPALLGEDALAAVAAAAPEEDRGWEARRQALSECLGQLSPRTRAIVNSRYAAGLRPPEIAALVAWSVGAVNVQLTRARRLLRECVRRKLAVEGR